MSVTGSSVLGAGWLACLLVWGASAMAAPSLERLEWTVDGVKREALVAWPAVEGASHPLVFGFHGHGGSMVNAARSFRLHELWPEAVVVYPQGLNTPGQLTDPEGKKSGWQSGPGAQGDRDLAFFDSMLASLKSKRRIDETRVYATGHSNGGGFTYLLWAMRGECLTAVAPSASAAGKIRTLLKPKPVLHVAGEGDELVKYSWQAAMIDQLVKLNQCGEPVAWEQDPNVSIYPSALGCPVLTAIHPGGHQYPRQAPEVIVKFFKSVPTMQADKNE